MVTLWGQWGLWGCVTLISLTVTSAELEEENHRRRRCLLLHRCVRLTQVNVHRRGEASMKTSSHAEIFFALRTWLNRLHPPDFLLSIFYLQSVAAWQQLIISLELVMTSDPEVSHVGVFDLFGDL